ncbi:MAG: amidohydrolase family protein [Candidatus Paceibacterota bacterium]
MLTHHKSFNIEFERLIQKLSFDSAEALGLSDRGRIEKGAIADLLLMKDGEVKQVFVSGVKAFADGRFMQGNGRVLRA